MQCPATLNTAEDTAVALDLPTLSPESSLGQELSPGLLTLNTTQHPLNCVNPSNLTSDRVGSIVTVKHIEVQLANLPTYFGVNEDQQIKEFGQLGGGWICVYVPEGTTINRPFPDYAPGQSAFTLYEPNQNVLGSGTWLEGGAYRQTNNQATVMNAGVVATSRYSDTPAGNNMRIRVPLSRKLNPGDSICMVFWVQTPIGTLSAVSVEDIALSVTYASKANLYVCLT